MKAFHEAEPIAPMCNNAGLPAYILNYRVFPYGDPYSRADAFRAMRWLRYHAAEFDIQPDKLLSWDFLPATFGRNGRNFI
ncbi:MAG: hypothetical protein ACOX17_06280 [Christensenellales bacterium]|jgi:acetyl esterase/lipase